jgi:HK97 family phage portal protein
VYPVLENLWQKRAISYQTLFAAGDDIALGNLSQTSINADNVFQVNAVYSAVSLIADTISTLPIDVFIRRDGARFPFRPKPVWVDKPDADLPREAFYSQILTSLLLSGNAFVRIFSNRQGEIVNMVTLNPMDVEVERQTNGLLRFTVRGEDRPLTTEEIIYIPDVLRPGKVRGVSRVEALKEDFGLALALRNFAATFFGQGTSMNGVIEFPGVLTAEQASQLTEAFDARHRGWKRGHKTGVLTGGATFKSTQTEPDKAQAIEARRFAVEDVARAFGIPSVFLNAPDSMSYGSYEQSALMFVTHTLRPLIGKIEGAFSPLLARVPGGDTAFLKFNLDGLARADLASRMSAYSTGLQSGFLTINDVRRLEDLRPIDDEAADTVRVPLANVAIDESHLKADETRVKMAQQLVTAGYQPEAVLEALGLPAIAHTGLASVQVRPAEEGGELNGGDE